MHPSFNLLLLLIDEGLLALTKLTIFIYFNKTNMCPGEENGCSARELVRIGSCRAERNFKMIPNML